LIVLDTSFIVDHACEIFGAISALLRAGGGPVGDMDEAIAAIALAYDAAIVSRDRHFQRVPGLKIVGY
jgi:tRNA(fMet)-specific endonuclease VapC